MKRKTWLLLHQVRFFASKNSSYIQFERFWACWKIKKLSINRGTSIIEALNYILSLCTHIATYAKGNKTLLKYNTYLIDVLVCLDKIDRQFPQGTRRRLPVQPFCGGKPNCCQLENYNKTKSLKNITHRSLWPLPSSTLGHIRFLCAWQFINLWNRLTEL